MSDLTARFEQAAKDVQELLERPSNEVLLELYALYKQATEGDCEGERPKMWKVKERAKYDAWATRRKTSREDAMKAYVDLVETLTG